MIRALDYAQAGRVYQTDPFTLPPNLTENTEYDIETFDLQNVGTSKYQLVFRDITHPMTFYSYIYGSLDGENFTILPYGEGFTSYQFRSSATNTDVKTVLLWYGKHIPYIKAHIRVLKTQSGAGTLDIYAYFSDIRL